MSPPQAAQGPGSNLSEPNVPELDASRFELLEAIGSGGMGTVYRALQRSVGRYVAVKMLAPEHAANATGLVRFVREANAIARLAHPNIVQLIDFGRDGDGRLLLVMELLEGESLRALLRRERVLDPPRAAWVAVQCLQALRTAHAAGVIHRDLKPENIFIHTSGAEDHVKVLDFGVAKLTQSDVGEHTTQGSLVGTLRYMAPEQIAGDPPDPRIDVYAMGVLLYEMLSGAVPYDTRDRFVLLRQIIAEEPVDLQVKAPHLAPELCAVVMHALTKSARDRFSSAEDFRRALLPFLASDVARSQVLSEAGARPPSASPVVPGLPGADFRSGVVRSGQVLDPGHATSSGRAGPPHPMDPKAGPGSSWPSATPNLATEHLPARALTPRARRGVTLAAVGVSVFLALLGGVAGYLYTQGDPSPPPPSTTAVHPAAPVQPLPPVHVPAPVRVPGPVGTPSLSPAPSPTPTPTPTRLVVLATTPPGARVSNPDGTAVCPATPCAIPVPVGQQRAVQITLGATSLSALLDGSQSTVTLDLGALTPTPPARHPTGAGRPHGQHPRHGDDGLPMFLPGGGH